MKPPKKPLLQWMQSVILITKTTCAWMDTHMYDVDNGQKMEKTTI
jgi:hypothetical protein